MGLFNRLGREVEQFKRTAEAAAAETTGSECPACETTLPADFDGERCPECGADLADGRD